MQLTNQKLRKRGQEILIRATGAGPTRAARALKAAEGSLPVALLMLRRGIKRNEAEQLLTRGESISSILRASMRIEPLSH